MKKTFSILLLFIFFITTNVKAQTANRSGWFADFQIGQNIGKIYDGYKQIYDSNSYFDYYSKGGVELGVGAGYQWRTSTHWAYRLKLHLQENLHVTDVFSIGFMTGMRYTSNNFGSGQSLYLSPQIGFDMIPFMHDFGFRMPIELEVGVNINDRFSLGLAGTYRTFSGGHHDDWYLWQSDSENVEYRKDSVLENNFLLSLRASYRF